ncbi:alpha/beta fold hydrolase [Fulvivirga sedimenti]|uniref:Alpha/beta hydrolase n=1 Tax=Fulvivirga sedimenti TaxID=2879465 RepID=A0A9X1HSV9_9BACT|nr:alpha/beta hydrolase [Fulvivirga sedimenti]MCA6075035.1 alpha/beta hydrolase [Fulvivirga sedimenti]MCA6076212.1 alpha/beta hydrolase [Fulvivirga sedimenti]MCA6077340.1 alpha/beta hydrolase [Fulvivirga sedimenti]
MRLNYPLLIIAFLVTFSNCNPPVGDDSESSFYSFDKTRIAYTDEGKGEPVILIHGFISNGSSWNNTALKKQLMENGYRVIIPDLRGNGNSDKPQSADAYKNNAEVKDLVALADHLGLTSFMAIGYSRGSIVLARLLTRETRISKAVFGGMGLDFTNPEWDRRIAFADAFSGRAEPNEMTEGAINYAKSINADLKVLGFLQDYQPVTSTEELRKIKNEILVICGDQDRDNGDPEELKNQFQNSTLIIVEGDHNNTYKQDNFAVGVLTFLTSS